MSAPSISVAAAAIGTYSISSSSHDRLSLRFPIPHKINPILKAPSRLNSRVKIITSRSLSPSPICCTSTAFDSVIGLSQEEEVPEIGIQETSEAEEEEEEVVEEEEEEEGDLSPSAETGRLYVGNLPFSTTSAQLSEIFTEAGRVRTVEIVYDRVTDRSRGFAFITMDSAEEAREAIRLFDGAQIGGRTAKVNFPEVPRGGEREVMRPKISNSYKGFVDSPYKIYAGNLSWGLASQGLREVFSEQPGFLSAKVIFDRDSGRSRGFGFITFSSSEEVESALNALNGVEVEGRPLRLNLAEQKGNSSSPPAAAVPGESESDLENSEMQMQPSIDT